MRIIKARPHSAIIFAAVVFLLTGLVFIFFYDVLFSDKTLFLSEAGKDLYREYIYSRDFGFRELRKGNLPLWNPHLFSGMPFFGGFQSALLYPPNLLYLFLPLNQAINLSIALHLLLAGVNICLWTWYRKLHPLACFVSAVLFMFCSAHFLHVYAGHLSNLCTLAWVPLVFLCIDGLEKKFSSGWMLLGAFSVTMQILAGHPQYVYYTAIAVGLYISLLLLKTQHRLRLTISTAAFYTGAALLSAVQLLSGIDAGAESVRGHGVPFDFAAMFSFPPENLITLFIPEFFGNMSSAVYWGRWYLWEMALFIGLTGFTLTILGQRYGKPHTRRYAFSMALILLILALGAYTPLFRILYTIIPGFDKFRGSSKFILFASLFMIMLAGIGLDDLLKRKRLPYKITIGLFISVGLLAFAAVAISHSAAGNTTHGFWAKLIRTILRTGQCYLDPSLADSAQFTQAAAQCAIRNLWMAAGTCMALAGIGLLSRYFPTSVFLVAILAIAEILVYAGRYRATFDLARTPLPAFKRIAEITDKDHRILNLVNPNSAITYGLNDIWGNDPGVLRRYAEFMTYTQGHRPDQATQYVQFTKFSNLYKMLRCQLIVRQKANQMIVQKVDGPDFPRAFLVDEYRLIPERDPIFKEMAAPSFDPLKTVILESAPDPPPQQSEKKGHVDVKALSTDALQIEADLPHAAILVVSDAYSRGWTARSIDPNPRQEYRVMPADYILRAIPLPPGHHRLMLEYRPRAFVIGKWISIVSVLIYLTLLSVFLFSSLKKRKQGLTQK